MKVSYTRDGSEFAVDTATLPQVSIDYLLQYGFAQSMQDTIAGLAKAKREELEGLENPPADIDGEISLAIIAQLERRAKAIAEGTVGVRVGQPRDEVTSLAREQVRVALARKKVKVTKEKMDELVSAHVEKNRDAIVAEIARRKESQVDVELAI